MATTLDKINKHKVRIRVRTLGSQVLLLSTISLLHTQKRGFKLEPTHGLPQD